MEVTEGDSFAKRKANAREQVVSTQEFSPYFLLAKRNLTVEARAKDFQDHRVHSRRQRAGQSCQLK